MLQLARNLASSPSNTKEYLTANARMLEMEGNYGAQRKTTEMEIMPSGTTVMWSHAVSSDQSRIRKIGPGISYCACALKSTKISLKKTEG